MYIETNELKFRLRAANVPQWIIDLIDATSTVALPCERCIYYKRCNN